jgi:acetyl esterase/lipase
LTSGTRDKLLSDTVRFHRALRAASIEAELHVFEAFGHAGFLGMAPEDAERAGGGFGAQHSDMLEGPLVHTPGLKVAPSSTRCRLLTAPG